jgi:DNA excision repair protein ERCC-5
MNIEAQVSRIQILYTSFYMNEQELVRLFGLPFVVSPMEAEAQCAFLDFTSQTNGTVTDDSDIWLFGGQNVYKNLFNPKRHVEWFSMSHIEKQLCE